MRGRDRDARAIREANCAAAVGRLMLGEVTSWNEYVSVGRRELHALPRKRLKAGSVDVKLRLNSEIDDFCRKNFRGMTIKKLAGLYDQVQPPYGLKAPLVEFEERVAKLNDVVTKHCPKHATVSISLWGLQFEFPEDHLSKDLRLHVRNAREANESLKKMRGKSHALLLRDQSNIATLHQQLLASVRASLFSCHSLMEAYFNGLGWEFLRVNGNNTALSEKQRKFLAGEEGTLRKKVAEFPVIISGKSRGIEYEKSIGILFDVLKPFRDSIAHPSPFSAPEKFGGYDKLSKLYEADYPLAELALTLTCDVLTKAHEHIRGSKVPIPAWLDELVSEKQWIVEQGTT